MYLAAQRNRAIVYRYAYRGATQSLILKSKQHIHSKITPTKPTLYPAIVINDLQPYKGKLVLSTRAGIIAMNPETETFEPLSPCPTSESLQENYIYVTFHIDRNDNIWLANGNGGITRVNLLTGKRQNYRHDLRKRTQHRTLQSATYLREPFRRIILQYGRFRVIQV